MPCLIRHNGREIGSLASMGGHSQPIILAQVLSRILRGDHPQDAVAAPRWVVQRASGGQPSVLVEDRMPADVRAALGAAAAVTELDHRDNRLGHCHALWQTPAGVLLGTDPRADGLTRPGDRAE